MQSDLRQTTRRGLTLLELMFAITITAIVAAALSTTVGAVLSGVDTQRDTRSHVVRAHAAQSRLGAYIVPSRAVLMANDSTLVLWINDARQSESVHGSEIRWLIFDESTGTINVLFVRLPSHWSEIERLIADQEHPKNSNWMSILNDYVAKGFIDTVTLVDGLADLHVTLDENHPLDSRSVLIHMTFDGEGGEVQTVLSNTLLRHRPPVW